MRFNRRQWCQIGLGLLLPALLIATHLPSTISPESVELGSHFDGLAHVLAYAVFSLMLSGALWPSRQRSVELGEPNWTTIARLLGVILAAGAVATVDELTQPFFGRGASWSDWTWDMFGVLLAVIAWQVFANVYPDQQ